MPALSRREMLYMGIAAGAGLARVGIAAPAASPRINVHRQILELAGRQQQQRRKRFAAVTTETDLKALQLSLRESFLRLLDGLPEAPRDGTPPAAKITGQVDADDYSIEKLVFESFPGYFVSALLYKPHRLDGKAPAVISPCGHSAVGKAADAYQLLHINLVKRGYIVLTYDPVGQGERSQFWEPTQGASRFNLTCGEHAVLGNPLYLLGTSLARYRIWDGIRALDYLTSLDHVDAKRIGCSGNSGGGTLTAYLAALDARITAAAISCYITTLPRRMANRVERDPDADPEQDIFGFVSEGIDHAGLLALRAPRPTLLCAAEFDFFPIEGARESFDEAAHLFQVAGAKDRLERAEAPQKHGLSLPLRLAIYRFFDRWLAGTEIKGEIKEAPVQPRPAKDLLVCADGQVNVTFKSRSLLPLALEEFHKAPKSPARSLRELLHLDNDLADIDITPIDAGGKQNRTLIICINGNESRPWREEERYLAALKARGYAVVTVDPRGVGPLRPDLNIKGHDYTDPLCGVEENIAYNAFLVGKSLLGMRVADVLSAVAKSNEKEKWPRVVLCGRHDAGLVACMAAALEPSVTHVAVEQVPLSLLALFEARGVPVNAASILPDMLRRYGDIAKVFDEIAPRRMLVAAGTGKFEKPPRSLTLVNESFAKEPKVLTQWLDE
ncbi:MAG: acetylxylan esterase [Phycisphaeraceae bacterium]